MKVVLQYGLWIVLMFNGLGGFGQITVDFSVSKRSGCGFVQSNFSDKSKSTAGAIISWEWDIGGSKVRRQNPSRIFGNPGKYKVCLTVKDNLGNTGTKCIDDYIIVYEELTIDFSANDTVLCAGDRTSFSETAFSPNGKITQFIWKVGGSAGTVTSDGTIPTVTSSYPDGGSYGISLTIKDDKGCTGTLTKSGYIQVIDPPNLDIVVSDPEICGALPHFTSYQLDRIDPQTFYSWDFGNGQTFNGPNPPIIQYDDNDDYDVTLSAVNSAGCRDTVVHKDVVRSSHQVTFDVDTTSGCMPLTIQFTDHSRIRPDSIVWDFGNGDLAFEKNPQYTYNAEGVFQPTLSRLVRGCWITESFDRSITVFGTPTANYALSRTLACTLPYDVPFSNLSSGADSYLWDFGDGNTSTDFNPVHRYTEYGKFPISLTANTDDGCSHQVVVDTLHIFEFKVNVTGTVSGCVPLEVTAEDNSSSLTPVIDWLWIFEGDTTLEFARPDINFTLTTPGKYDLIYAAANSTGCVDSIRIPDFAQAGTIPQVDYEFSGTLACVDQEIQFQDLSDSTVNSWFWEFSDGTTSHQQNPLKHFDEPGNYTTKLTGFYNGCPNSADHPDTIEVLIPQALFTYEFDCLSGVVNFQNASVGYDSLIWDFGFADSSQSVQSEIHPKFIYPGPGTYEVILEVFNSRSDCQHFFQETIVIADPSIDLSIETTTGCTPFIAEARGTFQDIDLVQYIVDGTGEINSVNNGANIIFRNPGIYAPIYAAITDMNGCKDTLRISDSLRINQIQSNIGVNKQNACVGDTILLTESSSSFYGQITAYAWEFNGDYTDEIGRSWIIDENEDQHISLMVENDWGCSDSASIAIDVHQALALFTTDSLACTSREIEFIHDSKGEGLTYLWEFGNGDTETANDTVFTYLYKTEGYFVPSLTVSDLHGCVNTFVGDTLLIADPIPAFQLDTNYIFCPPYELSPINTSQNASNFEWNFGDGSGFVTMDTSFHLITDPGVYDITLVAGHVDGCVDTLVRNGALTIGGPTGNIEFTIEPTCAPVTVHVSGQLDGPYSLFWDYGTGLVDTFPAAVQNFQQSYVYPQGGTFRPVLVLEDSLGCLRPLPQQVVRVNELTLDSDLSNTSFCGSLNNKVLAYNLTSSTHRIDSWNWNLIHADTTLSSTKVEPEFNLDRLGWYDLLVTAEHQYCKDTFYLEQALGIGYLPQVGGVISNPLGCDPFPLRMRDTSSVLDSSQFSVQWSANPIFDTTGIFVSQTFPEGQHVIKQKVTTEFGCSDSIFHNLEVLENAVLELPDSLKTCFGETITLEAPLVKPNLKNVIFHWSHESTPPCNSCDQSTITVKEERSYYVTATHQNGCSFQDTVAVYFLGDSVPQVEFQYDSVICNGDFTQLISVGDTSQLVFQWDSSIAGLNCYDRCKNPIASPLEDKSYIVRVSNQVGCTLTDTLDILVRGTRSIVGSDRTICLGDTVQLEVAGLDPFWHVADGLSCSYCNDPVAQPSSSTNYVVSSVDSTGCLIYDSIRVNVLTGADLDLGVDTFTCLGGSVQLTASGPGDIFWELDPGNVKYGTNTRTFQPALNTYYFAMLNNDKCTLHDSVLISVVEKAEIRAVGDTICVGDTANIAAVGMISAVEWVYDGVLFADRNQAKVVPPNSVDVMVVGSLSGCAGDTAYAVVRVLPKPNVSVPTQVVILDDVRNISLTNTSSIYSYDWSPPEGLSCYNCPDPVVIGDQSMKYYLTVTNSATSCQMNDSVQVLIPKDCIKDIVGIPNIFTPNGDGINDEFRIYASIPNITIFQVFNRWGNLLFETTNKDQGWDGQVNGLEQPPGVYAYYLEYICPLTDEPVLLFGDVTLLR